MRIALILRGHERDVFLNSRLYDFVKKYTELFPVDIYIHTWSKSVGQLSWRKLVDYTVRDINEKDVLGYFKDIPIKKLFIDDERTTQLRGNIDGYVCNGPCPKIAWKRMWHGKFKIIDYVRNESKIVYDFVLNMRMDVFQNINNIYSEEDIIEKTRNLMKVEFVNQIYFLKDEPCSGIDNCYFGNQTTMFFLTRDFHYGLDEIEKTYPKNFYTEYLVYFEALRFNYKIWTTILEETHNVNRIRVQ